MVYNNTNKLNNTNNINSLHSLILEKEENPVNLLLKEFESINPKKYYDNKTQRGACSRLLETYSLEVLKKMIQFVQVTNTRPYAPIITTPCELEEKIPKLKAFYDREKVPQKGVVPIFHLQT